MADLGAIGRFDEPSFSRRVDHILNTGQTPVARLADLSTFSLRYAPDYPENYWRRPLVLGTSRGPLYTQAGSDRLFRAANETTSPRDPNGWQWCGPWSAQLRYRVTEGDNTLTVSVQHNRPMEPTPQVRILPNPAIGVTGGLAACSPSTGIFQDLTINFTAEAPGFVTLALEWDLRSTGQRCVWKSLTMQP